MNALRLRDNAQVNTSTLFTHSTQTRHNALLKTSSPGFLLCIFQSPLSCEDVVVLNLVGLWTNLLTLSKVGSILSADLVLEKPLVVCSYPVEVTRKVLLVYHDEHHILPHISRGSIIANVARRDTPSTTILDRFIADAS